MAGAGESGQRIGAMRDIACCYFAPRVVQRRKFVLRQGREKTVSRNNRHPWSVAKRPRRKTAEYLHELQLIKQAGLEPKHYFIRDASIIEPSVACGEIGDYIGS